MKLHGLSRPMPVLDVAGTSRHHGANGDLLGRLLDEQRDLSAVERFAQFHEDASEPLQERYYRALLPATPPGPGQQLAFEVDLDRCSGCKACVAACHNLNGLDEGESWRDVGQVIGGGLDLPIIQHVTAACHHCLDPACLSACPVDAYEKDAVSGIVRHLDDQCFGCQYCTLACPYDAPKFHPGKGIVRKCDMCGDRLAAGEAPACVQSCPHEAIRIRVVDCERVPAAGQADDLLRTGSEGAWTRPTTVYRSSRLPGSDALQPSGGQRIAPEHPHWPLIVMLVLTQCSVGGLLVELLFLSAGQGDDPVAPACTILSLIVGWAGLAASVFHLGRPLYAYRALIGLRHSWLSREVLAFGVFAKLATAYAVIEVFWPAFFAVAPVLRLGLLASVAATGLTGVACSVMVYHAVRRPFWQASAGAIKFGGTTAILGAALTLAALGACTVMTPELLHAEEPVRLFNGVAVGLVAAASAKLWFEARLVRGFARSDHATLQATARLLGGPLKRPAGLRRFLGVVGGVVLPALAIVGAASADVGVASAAAFLALGASIAGETAERYLFFTAVVRPRMPGGLS